MTCGGFTTSYSIKAAIFLFLLAAFPAEAAIFGTDDRVLVDTAAGSPYAPVGLVLGAPRYGTGVLIADCYAITSQHIFGDRYSPIGRRLRFIGSVGSGSPVKSKGTVVAAGGLEQSATSGEPYEARTRDWILIKLDTCLGAYLGSATLVVNPRNSELVGVQSAGFPMDRSRSVGLTIDPSCGIRSVRPLVWLNDCAALGGNSGGPIFRIIGSGQHRRMQVYAIQSAAVRKRTILPFAMEYANLATPAWAILPHILSWIGPRKDLRSR
jgi:V8-like Glu-specific endopeptidase